MKKIKYFFIFLNLYAATSYQTAYSAVQKATFNPAADWLQQESQIAEIQLLKNISPPGTHLGVVIASPQNDNPDYFRNWVRDAALTMDVVLQLAKKNQDQIKAKYLNKLLNDYAVFSRQNQLAAGLGEPLFEVTGKLYDKRWGRPQNDGPALRAIVLIAWAELLIDGGQIDYVNKNLYQAELPGNSVIKADLEYVSAHWGDPCFDLWEEVEADHFYTKMVQRKALIMGAKLAQRLNDSGAANWYLLQAKRLENSIRGHIVEKENWIGASLNWSKGLSSKTSNLDISVILGVLHGKQDSFFAASDLNVITTFTKLKNVFSDLYPINGSKKSLAPALGRYPEDIYAGTDFRGGNPWVLATLAGAEYSYRVAQEVAATHLSLAMKWMKNGDLYVERVQHHANSDGTLSEQIDRNTGFMTSARDLTWNYSALLTTLWARQESELQLKKQQGKNK